MRIVLDTNVLISALLSPRSNSTQILRFVIDDAVSLVISRNIIDEANRVVRYPKLVKLLEKNGIKPDEIAFTIEKLSKIASVTPGELTLDVIQDDPSDNEIVACAVEGEADFIISGDHHLTELKEFRGIMILNPATLLAIVKREKLSD